MQKQISVLFKRKILNWYNFKQARMSFVLLVHWAIVLQTFIAFDYNFTNKYLSKYYAICTYILPILIIFFILKIYLTLITGKFSHCKRNIYNTWNKDISEVWKNYFNICLICTKMPKSPRNNGGKTKKNFRNYCFI